MEHLTTSTFRVCKYFALIAAICSSCQSKENDDLDAFDQNKVTEEVESAVWSFYTADTARNAQGVIDLLWPEYSMLGDGQRMTYEDVESGISRFMNSLTLFHTEWSDLDIIPISETAALSSFIFRDSLVFKEGNVTQARGPTTFLWQKREGQWKVLYGDADHYPIDQQQD